MQNHVLVALAKHLEKRAKEIELPAGQSAIDETVTLTIKGTVKRGSWDVHPDREHSPFEYDGLVFGKGRIHAGKGKGIAYRSDA